MLCEAGCEHWSFIWAQHDSTGQSTFSVYWLLYYQGPRKRRRGRRKVAHALREFQKFLVRNVGAAEIQTYAAFYFYPLLSISIYRHIA